MSADCGAIVPPHVMQYLKGVELSLVVDGRALLRFIPKET